MQHKSPVTAGRPETIVKNFGGSSEGSEGSISVTFRDSEHPVEFGGLRAFGE